MRARRTFGVVSLLFAALPLAACVAPVGTSGFISVPPDAAQTCAGRCQSIGLRLTAVAIMANNVGCVCQPQVPDRSAAVEAPRAASGLNDRRTFDPNGGAVESATTTAGMVAILMENEKRRSQWVSPPPNAAAPR